MTPIVETYFRHQPAIDREGPALVDRVFAEDVGDHLRAVEGQALVVALLVDDGLHAGRLVVGDLEHLVDVGELRDVAVGAPADLFQIVEHDETAGLVDEADHRLGVLEEPSALVF